MKEHSTQSVPVRLSCPSQFGPGLFLSRLWARLAIAVTIIGVAHAGMAQDALGLVPLPASVELKTGTLTFNNAATLRLRGKGAQLAATQLISRLRTATGFVWPTVTRSQTNQIEIAVDPKLKNDLGTEGYRLVVNGDRATLVAADAAGAFYATQTLMQLLPVEIFGTKPSPVAWTTPCVTIEDRPRFSWRGAHMDTARHFMPKAFLLKFLDVMAAHKLNVFHWHLTDDQGWRLEIKKYPLLTEIGSKRSDSMLDYNVPTYSGKPHEGFYTQADVREVVAYAAARFIRVVPEIEMPGHAQAAIAAYPELGQAPERLQPLTKWGVSQNVFNVKDSTIAFLQDVLDETMQLFPGQFIHIGGDECPKDQWKANAFAQAKLRKLGLKDEHELQSWFVRQMDGYLDAKGRRLIGWSEILEGGLAPGAALMVWLNDDGALEAVRSGHDVVMAQTTHTYFDYYQARNPQKEPHGIGGYLPLEKAYSYNPILPSMTAQEGAHVLGTQFQLWSEYISTPDHMEYMAFPRGCALAEVAWTDPNLKRFDAFRSRLTKHLKRLDAMGVRYRHLDSPQS